MVRMDDDSVCRLCCVTFPFFQCENILYTSSIYSMIGVSSSNREVSLNAYIVLLPLIAAAAALSGCCYCCFVSRFVTRTPCAVS